MYKKMENTGPTFRRHTQTTHSLTLELKIKGSNMRPHTTQVVCILLFVMSTSLSTPLGHNRAEIDDFILKQN